MDYTYQDDDSEPSSRKEQIDPGLDLGDLDVEAWGDYTSLVQTSIELDDDFAGTMVIDDLKFTDIACNCVKVSNMPKKIANQA